MQRAFTEALHAGGTYANELFEAMPAKTMAAAIAALNWLILPPMTITKAIILFLIADWLTGTARSIIRDDYNSDGGWRGAIKVLVYIGILKGCQGLDVGGIVGTALAYWARILMLTTEAKSVCENIDALGQIWGINLPVLQVIARAFKRKSEALEAGPEALEKLNTQTETKGE